MYAVPGQHDLQNHRLKDLKRTAFWTMVEAGKIVYLPPGEPVQCSTNPPVCLYGFPWGTPPRPLKHPHSLTLEVAVVHAYVWTKHTGHPGAAPEHRLKRYAKALTGYDAAVFGDNHTPFLAAVKTALGESVSVLNHGAFVPRTMSERHHVPHAGLLHADGTLERAPLRAEGDRWLEADADNKEGGGAGLEAFVDELQNLAACAADFEGALRRCLDAPGVPGPVRDAALAALEKARGKR